MNVVDSSGWLEYFADGPNADFFEERGAATVLSQIDLSKEGLAGKTRELLENKKKLDDFSENIRKLNKPDAAERIVSEIFKALKHEA